MTLRLIEATFPDYATLLDLGPLRNRLSVDEGELSEAVERAALVTSDSSSQSMPTSSNTQSTSGWVAVGGHVCSSMAVRTILPVPPCSMRWANASLASDRG